MELTISITEQTKFDFFIKLLREFQFIQILDIKEETSTFPIEHKQLIDKRLQRIDKGETIFKSWDLIKKKYEKSTL